MQLHSTRNPGRLLLAFVTLLAAFALFGSSAMADTTLPFEHPSELGANHYMASSGGMYTTGDARGHIDASTRTLTRTLFGGFTGGVKLIFEDARGITIGQSEAHTYGVDGKWIGNNDRTDYWSEDIAPDVAERTVAIHVAHFWAPTWGALGNIIRWGVDAAMPIGEILNALREQGANVN
jgi:hypothetical protein